MSPTIEVGFGDWGRFVIGHWGHLSLFFKDLWSMQLLKFDSVVVTKLLVSLIGSKRSCPTPLSRVLGVWPKSIKKCTKPFPRMFVTIHQVTLDDVLLPQPTPTNYIHEGPLRFSQL